jgi:hypothetical protein
MILAPAVIGILLRATPLLNNRGERAPSPAVVDRRGAAQRNHDWLALDCRRKFTVVAKLRPATAARKSSWCYERPSVHRRKTLS